MTLKSFVEASNDPKIRDVLGELARELLFTTHNKPRDNKPRRAIEDIRSDLIRLGVDPDDTLRGMEKNALKLHSEIFRKPS